MEKKEYNEKINKIIDMIAPIGTYRETFDGICKQNSYLSTGFHFLDCALHGGLVNELYIMGAETSTGKSAFLMHIAQSIAASDKAKVLYFALEMSKAELIARGISSISFEKSKEEKGKRPLTASEILYASYDDTINEFTKLVPDMYKDCSDKYFSRYGKNLIVVEGGMSGFTARDLANVCSVYKKESTLPVVVFVDYLQLLRADPTDRSQTDRKTKLDISVTTLKALASQIGMPVITVSSISRASYGDKVSTASYKESGDTEYTGGILLGWNWDGVTDEKDPKAIEEEKNDCRKRGYRHMTLEILKYRNGERDAAAHFRYYPAYSYFEEYNGKEGEDIDTSNHTPEKVIKK